jgi:hypothetical protein
MMAYIDIKAAAKFTGLSEMTLRRAIRVGRFPYIRAGGPGSNGKLLFDPELLSAALERESWQCAPHLPEAGFDESEPPPEPPKSYLAKLFQPKG